MGGVQVPWSISSRSRPSRAQASPLVSKVDIAVNRVPFVTPHAPPWI